MNFLESLINGEQDEKKFRIVFVVCQQFTFKIRLFWFTAVQTEARERMMSKEELTPSGLSRFRYMQELSKPWARYKLFKGYPSSFYSPANSVVTLKISEAE